MIRQRQLHCVDHHVSVRRAVAAEHAVDEELRARRDAHDLTCAVPVRGRNPGDVSAVTGVRRTCPEHFLPIGEVRITREWVAVRMRNRLERGARRRRVVLVADEVEAAADLAGRPEAAAELRQRVVEAAIHDRDRHAGAVQPELVVRDVRAGQPDRVLQLDVSAAAALGLKVGQRDGVHRIDGLDARDRPQRGHLRRRHRDRYAVPERVVRIALRDFHAVGGCVRLERIVFRLELRRARTLDRRRARKLHEPARRRLVGCAANSPRGTCPVSRECGCNREAGDTQQRQHKPQTRVQHFSLPSFRGVRDHRDPSRTVAWFVISN